MNPPNDFDQLLTRLDRPAPDPIRAERTRAACRRRLASHAPRTQRHTAPAPERRGAGELLAVAAAATVFLGEVAFRALRLYGLLGE